MLKKLLLVVLSTSIVGRPLRKLTFISISFIELMQYLFRSDIWSDIHRVLDLFYWKQPYVKKVSWELGTTPVDHVKNIIEYYELLRNRLVNVQIQPKISILVPVYKVKIEYFEECIQSVVNQIYQNWELCIVDDRSECKEIIGIIKKYQKEFPDKIKFTANEVNSHISVTSNNCLKLVTGEYTSLLDHDDRLYPNALAEVVLAVNENSEPDILYSDEVQVDAEGNTKSLAYLKPDWSPFMHLCMNYTTHLSTYRSSLLRDIGGFTPGLEGSQDHDLMLRMVEASVKPVVHIPKCLYQWRAHENSTASGRDAKPYAAIAGQKAVSQALKRRGVESEVGYDYGTGHYKIDFALPENLPLVSIIIYASKFSELNEGSIEDLTNYKNVEYIVISGDDSVESIENYDVLRRDGTAVASYDNAVRRARGDYVLFLDDNLKPLSISWLEEMVAVCQNKEVGIVGAKILQKSKKYIASFGLYSHVDKIVRWDGYNVGVGRHFNASLYDTMHEVSAVPEQCMLIKKSVFIELGGFNTDHLGSFFWNVDFSFRAKNSGYSTVVTPEAELALGNQRFKQDEPDLKATKVHDMLYMKRNWSRELIRDPYKHELLKSGYVPKKECRYLDLMNKDFKYFLNTPPGEVSKSGYQEFIDSLNP